MKAIWKLIVLFIVIHALNGLVFFLFRLPMEVYWVLFGNLTVVMTIYIGFQVGEGRQHQLLKERYDALQQSYQADRTSSIEKQSDMEAYFMLWVHQMKTPIAASQLLLKNNSETTTTKLQQELLAIENYTNMALNYLKLTNPSTDMVITTVSLDTIMSPLLRKYRSHFIARQITLHYLPIHHEIVTEANLTSLMIEQLLSNALKYTAPAPQPRQIWIEFDEAKSILRVSDSGIGIQSQDLPKIFQKGYSGFNGQLNQKSSGIGLFLVKMIAERLDQEVTVDSHIGQGTTFTVAFLQNRKLAVS